MTTIKNFFEKYQNGNEMVDIDTILRYANNQTLNELIKKYYCSEAIIMYLGQYDRICICGNEGDFDRSFDDNTEMSEVIEYLINSLESKNLYNVIAKCTDGDVMIGKDGIYNFNYDEAKRIADDHMTLGAEIIIVNAL